MCLVRKASCQGFELTGRAGAVPELCCELVVDRVGEHADLDDERKDKDHHKAKVASKRKVIVLLLPVRLRDRGDHHVNEREDERHNKLVNGILDDDNGKADKEELAPHLAGGRREVRG